MKKLITAVTLSLLTVMTPHWAAADDLLGIYQLAVEADPQLRAADAARKATEETKPQAKALYLPNISAGANIDNNRQDIEESDIASLRAGTNYYTTKGYSLSLTQPIFHQEYLIQLRQADSQIAQAEAEYRAAEQDLIVRVSERYFDVLAAEDNLRFARAEKSAVGRQLEQAKKRFEVGLVAITDVHEAQARYDQTVAAEIEALNAVDVAREALQEITGRFHSQLATLVDPVPLIKPEPQDIDQWINSALGQNLSLMAAQAAAETAREQINLSRTGHYPTLDLVASHGFNDTGGGLFGSRETTDSAIGLQLAVPIYQGGGVNSQIRQSQHLFDQATENVVQQRRATIRQTRAAYLTVLAGISRVEALEQAVVSAQSALDATQAGFEVGTRTIVDVLLQEGALYDAQRNYARARYDYILNTLRLKQAAGSLSPDDVKAVNDWLKTNG